ncbi:hypothetical protein CCR75_005181 [Bremia lactucae]|uniref:DNA helicase n=1 Tax=Bremia lactucae TaxID=4779 RepID=A0A976IFU8_BRELC|nr:hypothetical protein CCR75_008754 [Bremia lactucae]TDH70352.1 hypothetical protein CCR75_005181 [Bremia lactucae]
MAPSQVTLEAWLASTRRLLSIEQEEEVHTMRKELAQLNDTENPNVLTHLTLSHYSTGLFGRTLLQFSFPSIYLRHAKVHHMTVGDLVQIRLQATILGTGIVSRLEEHTISVAVNSDHDDVDEAKLVAAKANITLDRLVNNATYNKLTNALDQLTKSEFGAAQAVIDVVFSENQPTWETPVREITPFTIGLNKSQVEAVQFALASQDLALIHGPPGTGKTTTVIEFLLQAVCTCHYKVLVCAPSNIAVDNVLAKFANKCVEFGKIVPIVRVGHPARVVSSIVKYCFDARIQEADGTKIVRDIRRETKHLQRKLHTLRDSSERKQLRRELKSNRKDIREREQRVAREIVQQSRVVFATNVGAATTVLRDVTFDVVVIDEAAQALEIACWVPILKAKRCVLAGDHLQLPPTIKSKVAATNGLDVTLFDRMTHLERMQPVIKLLDTQYRMHEDISAWSSRAMYKGELKDFEYVAKRKLHELPHVSIPCDDRVLNATLLLIDTAGCLLEEDDQVDLKELVHSRSNNGEARIVAQHVSALLTAGVREEEIAVITPYSKQVEVLKALLRNQYPELEIRSVDGFQGCEKEAVVMSLVRSNKSRQVGFLADDRRMNVAMTRAKRHIAIVCDTETISTHSFLASIVEHFEELGEYQSAQEYLDNEIVRGSLDGEAIQNQRSSVCCNVTNVKKVVSRPLRKRNAKSRGESALQAKTESFHAIPSSEKSSDEEVMEDNVVAVPSVFQLLNVDSEDESDQKNQSDQDEVKLNDFVVEKLHFEKLSNKPVTKVKKKKKKMKKNSAKTAISGEQEQQDEWEYLTYEAALSSQCAYQHPSRCKKSVVLLGSICKFCKLKFCYDHVQQEVHGCGKAVRTFERAAFLSRPKDLTTKRLTSDKRTVLQKKLQATVSAKTASRTIKSKEK